MDIQIDVESKTNDQGTEKWTEMKEMNEVRKENIHSDDQGRGGTTKLLN